MGTKYSSQSTSGYNSSPPVDDGTASEANKVKWSTIKTKLADVLKTFGEAINTALVTALDKSCRTTAASDSAAASDHDRTIQVTSSGVTITLADATTMAAGYTVSVSNQSGGVITVALATATDLIDTVTNATQSIEAKETKRYIVNTSANGYISASRYGTVTDLTEDTSPDLGADYLETYDASVGRRKKVLFGRAGSGVLMTEQIPSATTVCDFTGIPSWAKKITVQLVGVSTNGTDDLLIQIGDSGGVETTSYVSVSTLVNAATPNTSSSTAGFIIHLTGNAATVRHGAVTLTLEDSSDFTWVASGCVAQSDVATICFVAGSKALSAALDRVRVTTVSGTDTFDAGSVNILYE
jgi:hypothetical protein